MLNKVNNEDFKVEESSNIDGIEIEIESWLQLRLGYYISKTCFIATDTIESYVNRRSDANVAVDGKVEHDSKQMA